VSESVQMMAQRVNRVHFEVGAAAADEMLVWIDQHHGREVVFAVLDEMERQAAFMFAEQRAEHERHERQMAGVWQIFTGLPPMKFSEACRIKAAQGDPLAQKYIDWFNSRECRLEEALTEAAVAVHPGWRAEG
jgi:hypothetical protein